LNTLVERGFICHKGKLIGNLIGGTTKSGRGGVGATGATLGGIVLGVTGKPVGLVVVLLEIPEGGSDEGKDAVGIWQVGKTQTLNLLPFKLPLKAPTLRLTGCSG
jgi:hypothetical protein